MPPHRRIPHDCRRVFHIYRAAVQRLENRRLIYLIPVITTLVFGAVLLAKGPQYRRQGRRFPGRYGVAASPWLIIFYGFAMLLLSGTTAIQA